MDIGIGIGHKEDLIIGYRYQSKNFHIVHPYGMVFHS